MSDASADERVTQAADLARDVAPDLDVVLLTHYPDVETLGTLRPGETDLQAVRAVTRAVAAEMVQAGVEILVQRADRQRSGDGCPAGRIRRRSVAAGSTATACFGGRLRRSCLAFQRRPRRHPNTSARLRARPLIGLLRRSATRIAVTSTPWCRRSWRLGGPTSWTWRFASSVNGRATTLATSWTGCCWWRRRGPRSVRPVGPNWSRSRSPWRPGTCRTGRRLAPD